MDPCVRRCLSMAISEVFALGTDTVLSSITYSCIPVRSDLMCYEHYARYCCQNTLQFYRFCKSNLGKPSRIGFDDCPCLILSWTSYCSPAMALFCYLPFTCAFNSDGFLKPWHHSTCTHVRRSGPGVDALFESLSGVGAGSWLFAHDVSFVSVPRRLPARPGGNLSQELTRNMFIYLNDHCSPMGATIPNVAPVVAMILHYSLRDTSLRAPLSSLQNF